MYYNNLAHELKSPVPLAKMQQQNNGMLDTALEIMGLHCLGVITQSPRYWRGS
jgi:hypothetical protein